MEGYCAGVRQDEGDEADRGWFEASTSAWTSSSGYQTSEHIGLFIRGGILHAHIWLWSMQKTRSG